MAKKVTNVTSNGMDFRMGTDLVFLPRFRKALEEHEAYFRTSVFFKEEWEPNHPERMAGIFASKEACCKAFGMQGGDWLAVRVAHEENGSPKIDLCAFAESGWHNKLSLAHEEDYVIATVLFWQP